MNSLNLNKKKIIARELLVFVGTIILVSLLLLIRWITLPLFERKLELLTDEYQYINGYLEITISPYKNSKDIEKSTVINILAYYALQHEPRTIFISVAETLPEDLLIKKIEDNYLIKPNKEIFHHLIQSDLVEYTLLYNFFSDLRQNYLWKISKKKSLIKLLELKSTMILIVLISVIFPGRYLFYATKWAIYNR